MRFPANFARAEEGGFVVTFPDIPEAITQGDDEAEAMDAARDALETALDFYFEAGGEYQRPRGLNAASALWNCRPAFRQRFFC